MRHRTSKLRELEGRLICVALTDGSRIDDCELVSAGRGRAGTMWIFNHGGDTFIPFEDVFDVWQGGQGLRGRPAA